MLGKHLLLLSSFIVKENRDHVLEEKKGQRPGFERTPTVWVLILDLHFLSCVTLSTFSYPSEPLSNGADNNYLTGCVRSFICKVSVVINDKTLDLWPRSLKLTPDLLLSLCISI